MTSSKFEAMQDKAYRHGIVSAQIEIDLPLQIRALRKERNWNQPELAKKAGMKQPRVSAMEKAGGANFTLETLKRLAEAFDVALVVRFAPFSELMRWSDEFNPDRFSAKSFEKEKAELTEEERSICGHRIKKQTTPAAVTEIPSAGSLPQAQQVWRDLGRDQVINGTTKAVKALESSVNGEIVTESGTARAKPFVISQTAIRSGLAVLNAEPQRKRQA